MQLLAMAMARWVLPVPVPPTSTALRCWAIKSPPASSLTSVWLIGVPSNWKSARSLASGSFRMVMHLGVGDAFIEQPGVQLVKSLEPQTRREEALADEPDLVLDLP